MTLTQDPRFLFARHYVEMVLVMFAGMFVIGGALLGIVAALGTAPDAVRDDAPGLFLAGMGFSMTAPMVWWMQRRGHSRPATRDMAIAMILPTAATLAFLVTGAIADIHALLMIEHIAMFPLMLLAMVPYRSEFTGRSV